MDYVFLEWYVANYLRNHLTVLAVPFCQQLLATFEQGSNGTN